MGRARSWLPQGSPNNYRVKGNKAARRDPRGQRSETRLSFLPLPALTFTGKGDGVGRGRAEPGHTLPSPAPGTQRRHTCADRHGGKWMTDRSRRPVQVHPGGGGLQAHPGPAALHLVPAAPPARLPHSSSSVSTGEDPTGAQG